MDIRRSIRFRLDRFLTPDPLELAAEAGVRIGADVRLAAGSSFGGHATTTIGDHTWFAGPVTVDGEGRADFGRWVAIGTGLAIITSDHDVTATSLHFGLADLVGLDRPIGTVGHVTVGNGSWIGDRVTILCGGAVGDGAIVGAGSIVTKPVPPFSIAVGAPARVVRRRFPDAMVTTLLDLAWWDWDDDRIRRNRRFFAADPATLDPQQLRELVIE